MSPQLSASLKRDGFFVVDGVLDEDAVGGLADASQRLVAGGSGYGIRNLFTRLPKLRGLIQSRQIRELIDPLLGESAQAVRGILFDKTANANWKVAWHQDLSIPVRERKDVNGFGPWSTKDGVVHVQPPRAILERMLTVRIHLDDCDESNGPLRVLPGSHAQGVLSPAEVEMWRGAVEPVNCCVRRGGAVLMRPLLLHASSSAQLPGHRRVIHVEFAAAKLPGGLEWAIA